VTWDVILPPSPVELSLADHTATGGGGMWLTIFHQLCLHNYQQNLESTPAQRCRTRTPTDNNSAAFDVNFDSIFPTIAQDLATTRYLRWLPEQALLRPRAFAHTCASQFRVEDMLVEARHHDRKKTVARRL
jgi:hypothetical protein